MHIDKEVQTIADEIAEIPARWHYHPHFKTLLSKYTETLAQVERVEKRIVPDMSLMSHNDHFQLKMLVAQFGAEYIVNAARHIDYLLSLKGEDPNVPKT